MMRAVSRWNRLEELIMLAWTGWGVGRNIVYAVILTDLAVCAYVADSAVTLVRCRTETAVQTRRFAHSCQTTHHNRLCYKSSTQSNDETTPKIGS